MLLKGLDEVGLTLAQAQAIETFEKSHFASQPWLLRAG
jgi:3-isopropylmalate dehydratase small subunit